MATRRPRKTPSIARQAAELAVAVPQVIAHRLTRLALAGPAPSARDRKEFRRMGAEKAAAFAESWNAMARQTLEATPTLASSFLGAFGSPARARSFTRPPPVRSAARSRLSSERAWRRCIGARWRTRSA